MLWDRFRYNLLGMSPDGPVNPPEPKSRFSRLKWIAAALVLALVILVVMSRAPRASEKQEEGDFKDEDLEDPSTPSSSKSGDTASAVPPEVNLPDETHSQKPPENPESAEALNETQIEEWVKAEEPEVAVKKSVIPRPPDVPKTVEEALAHFQKYPKNYFERYKAQLFFCGSLCDMSEFEWNDHRLQYSAKFLQDNFVSKSIDCDMLYSKEAEEVLDAPAFEWPPPSSMPLLKIFTLGGNIRPWRWFHTDRYLGGRGLHPVWSKGAIKFETGQLHRGVLRGTYGAKVTNFLFKVLRSVDMKDKDVLVIGSEKPWVEIAALEAGARHVTTLEYGKIVSEDPRITTMRPFEFNEMYRNGSLPEFDVAISFSSLEHSGLGRYGDGINPWGDLITMARTSCVVKQKTGHVVIGVPSGVKDGIYYNAHRIFGPNRWPLFLTNWWAEKFYREHEGVFENGIAYARNERA